MNKKKAIQFHLKTAFVLFMVLITTACVKWTDTIEYRNAIWSDKGDKISFYEVITSSSSSFFFPGPGTSKVKQSVIFTDADFNISNNFILFNENTNAAYTTKHLILLYFSEFENYGVYWAFDKPGSTESGIFKILDLSGNEIFSTLFNEQKQCLGEAPNFSSLIPALIPSPNGQFLLNAKQLENCNVVVQILDVRDDFSIKNTFELPQFFNGKIAWSEDEDIIAQSTVDSDQETSWVLYLDGTFESYEFNKFNDECFVPSTASHYVSRKLDYVYIDSNFERSVVNLVEESENLISLTGQWFFDGTPQPRDGFVTPLNVFGCEPVK